MLTEPFADQVQRAIAYYETDRPLPAVVLPHPMQNIDAAGLEQRAVALADAAMRLLDDAPRSPERA
ncbi:MAG: hypothetical protein AB7V43_17065 [Acidimicrobiia bacterium]